MPSKNTKAEQEHTLIAPLVINAQYVKDVSFENPHPFEHGKDSQTHPEINVNINVSVVPLEGRTYEVSLHLSAKAEKGSKTMFVAEVDYAGAFTLGDIIEEKNVAPILMIECPRLLFPFARALLADLTREGGYPPLTLHPIDFVDLYRRQQAQVEQVSTSH